MQSGVPPRFVPTLTEVVPADPADAPAPAGPGTPGAPAGGGAADASGQAPQLQAWQLELDARLQQAVAGVLQSCPSPAGASQAQVQQAVQAALARAGAVLHARN